MFSAGLSLVADGLSTGTVLTPHIWVMRTLCDVHADIYAGQIQDMQLEGKVGATEEEYLEMISKTTAKFIQASLVVGALMSGMNESIVKALGEIGHSMGIAYQIRDDILDLVRDSECTGKPLGGDLRQGKMRLPVIRALSRMSPHDGRRLGELIAGKPLPAPLLEEAITLVKGTDAVSYCIDKVRTHCDAAKRALDGLGLNVEVKAKLRTVLDLVAS
jgi:geranylgeranyl pyrophosphate synthase